MKKILVLFISTLILFCCSVYAAADDDAGWCYRSNGWHITDDGIIDYLEVSSTKNSEAVELKQYLKGEDVTITIPKSIGSVEVTGLGDNWLGGLDYVDVYIPDNIRYISETEKSNGKNNVYYFKKGSYADEFFKNSGLNTQYVDSVKEINLEDNAMVSFINSTKTAKEISTEKIDYVTLDLKNEFKNKIQQYNSGRYFLFDVNGDEVPELFIWNIDENGNILTDNSEMIKTNNNRKTLFTNSITYYGSKTNSGDSKEGIYTSASYQSQGYKRNGVEYDGFSGGKYSFYIADCNGIKNLILFNTDTTDAKSDDEGSYSVVNKGNKVLLFDKYFNSYQNKFSYTSISNSVFKKFLDGKRIYASTSIGSIGSNVSEDDLVKFISEIRKNPVTTYSVTDMTGLDSWDFSNIKMSSGNEKTDNEVKTVNNDISVILNNNQLSFTQSPVIENGTTLVPMRAIFEAMGASVDWNNDTKTVTSVKGDTTIILTLNKDKATVNGDEIPLVVPAKLVNGNTMVPLRFVSESLGAEVDWNGESRTVTING